MSISKADMTNFILYIKCTEQAQFQYSDPFPELLKKQFPEVTFLDLDNFSENELIGHACKALETSDKCGIVFQLEEESNTRPFLKLITYLTDHPEKCRVFLNGKNELVSKLLFPQENFTYYDLTKEEQINILEKFLL